LAGAVLEAARFPTAAARRVAGALALAFDPTRGRLEAVFASSIASVPAASRTTSIFTRETSAARAPAIASHGAAQVRAAPPSTPNDNGISKYTSPPGPLTLM
jgi:hypothetical protein